MATMQDNIETLDRHRLMGRDAFALEILATLQKLGGSAHIGFLATVLAASRRSAGGLAPSNLADLVEGALQAFEGALFHRPFGPQSLRWAVCQNASAEMMAQALTA